MTFDPLNVSENCIDLAIGNSKTNLNKVFFFLKFYLKCTFSITYFLYIKTNDLIFKPSVIET